VGATCATPRERDLREARPKSAESIDFRIKSRFRGGKSKKFLRTFDREIRL
jgi:hypothetical protein